MIRKSIHANVGQEEGWALPGTGSVGERGFDQWVGNQLWLHPPDWPTASSRSPHHCLAGYRSPPFLLPSQEQGSSSAQHSLLAPGICLTCPMQQLWQEYVFCGHGWGHRARNILKKQSWKGMSTTRNAQLGLLCALGLEQWLSCWLVNQQLIELHQYSLHIPFLDDYWLHRWHWECAAPDKRSQ